MNVATNSHPRQLLILLNVAAEDSVCRLFLPFWQKSGCDLLFSSPDDAKSTIEGVSHFHTGKSIDTRDRSTWYQLQSRTLDTMKHCLTLDYDGFLFTHYDSISLCKLPDIGPDDSIHHLAGGPIAGFSATFFLHPPWCFGKNRLKQFVEAASKYPITIERGFQDMWLSFVMEDNNIPFTHADWSWSANSIDSPILVESARKAVQNGFKFIHGVKNQAQLSAILQP